MSDLSDFLGHILEELTRARIQADIEAVKTAKRYVADEEGLLRNFPIPRMRLPQVEITAPVLISDVPEGYIQKTNPNVLQESVANDVINILKSQRIKIKTEEIVRIIKEDKDLSRGYLNDYSAESFSRKIGDYITQSGVKKVKSAATHAKVVALIREQLNKTFEGLPKKPVGININPLTSAVKEANTPDVKTSNLVYMKMTITEEGLEIDFEQPSEVPKEKEGAPTLPESKRVIRKLVPE